METKIIYTFEARGNKRDILMPNFSILGDKYQNFLWTSIDYKFDRKFQLKVLRAY